MVSSNNVSAASTRAIPTRLSTPRYDAYRMIQPPTHMNSHMDYVQRSRGHSNSSWMTRYDYTERVTNNNFWAQA